MSRASSVPEITRARMPVCCAIGLEELAAVFRFAHGAGGDGHGLVDAVRFGQTPELRQHLERRLHRFRRERPAVEAAGAEADHLFFAVDDLEGQIGAHLHDDHVHASWCRCRWRPVASWLSLRRVSHYNQGFARPYHVVVHTALRPAAHPLDDLHGCYPASKTGTCARSIGARVASRGCASSCRCSSSTTTRPRKLERRLRKVTRRLGRVRELDVLLLLMDELHESRRGGERALRRVARRRPAGARRSARDRLPARTSRLSCDASSRKLGQCARKL